MKEKIFYGNFYFEGLNLYKRSSENSKEFKHIGQMNSGRAQWGIGKNIFINSDIQEGGTFIECGALDGNVLSVNKFFEFNLKWNCINIEASPTSFEKLVKNRPNATNLNYALSSIDGDEIKIWDNAHKPKLNRIIRDGNKAPHHIVKTITYRTLIKDLNLTSVDAFVLDVEGHEKEVLKGMAECDVLPDVFCIEEHPSNKSNIQEGLKLLNADYLKIKNVGANGIYKRQN